ncbi:hypothetical protein CYMTET_40521 [Cymbomonas tetramitiformis]|uniref:Uncharacterized protein n=1 Tax=Cymbomonas tetramitiformis TaxID=36881 RepID=A0AAE0C956_9CHLO|nr:hypothetical protein CYMTET_40521 [Cymbomonas tetramitiformis]
MASADSVMRIAMERFIGVGGYRSDAYIVFEGTACPDGKGMYYKEYVKKVEQTLHTVRGATTVHAWDPSLFLDKAGHDRLVALAERGGDPSMIGRHGRGALERIPYFDPMRAYAHPYGHAKLYGVVKRTLKLFIGKLKNIDRGVWQLHPAFTGQQEQEVLVEILRASQESAEHLF